MARSSYYSGTSSPSGSSSFDRYQFLRQRSLPVTMKKMVPEIPAVAFLYSEELLTVYDVFETQNLSRCVNSAGQIDITNVFSQDINARIGWVPCADSEERKRLYHRLQAIFFTSVEIGLTIDAEYV